MQFPPLTAQMLILTNF